MRVTEEMVDDLKLGLDLIGAEIHWKEPHLALRRILEHVLRDAEEGINETHHNSCMSAWGAAEKRVEVLEAKLAEVRKWLVHGNDISELGTILDAKEGA